MSSTDLVALVDRLRALPTETEWLEFKRNHVDPQELGEYLSALANEAALCRQPQGHLVFGIDNATHAVLGTDFDAYASKAKGNQDLLPWLGALLQPNPGVEVQAVSHPDGRVVLLSVGPARDRPVDDLLLPKLPDRMTAEQKRRKVHNLLQELRRGGRIANQGTRGEPRWVIAKSGAASA